MQVQNALHSLLALTPRENAPPTVTRHVGIVRYGECFCTGKHCAVCVRAWYGVRPRPAVFFNVRHIPSQLLDEGLAFMIIVRSNLATL